MSDRLLRITALALLVILGSYQFAVFGLTLRAIVAPRTEAERGFVLGAPWPSVSTADEAATAAGLRPGDRVLEVQGEPFHGYRSVDRVLDKLFPGDRIHVTVVGVDGAQRKVSWQLKATDTGPRSIARYAFIFALAVLMPLLCHLVGFWAVFVRPREPRAWLLLAMLAAFSHSVVNAGLLPLQWGWFADFCIAQHFLLGSSWPLFMFSFACFFPRTAPWQNRYPFVFWCVAAAALVAATSVVTTGFIATWGNPVRWAPLYNQIESVSPALRILQMICVSLFFALLSHKLWFLEDRDSKRRVQIIVMGGSVALLPLFIVIIASLVTGRNPSTFSEWVTLPALLCMGVFPLSMGYAIVVHKAFGVGMVLRQSLKYALAQRGVRILQALLTFVVLAVVVSLATQPGVRRPVIPTILGLGVMVIVLLQRASLWVNQWVDRRFFRDAYDAEQLLASLSDDVRTMMETRPLLETVAARIAKALHVQRIAMLLRDGPEFQPAFVLGEPKRDGNGIGESWKIAELLQETRKPLHVYFEDKSSWIHRSNVSEAEREWLQSTKAELLLPLAVKTKLLGFINLGPKKSEEPYSRTDVQLLQSVATQTGLALENAHLAEAIADAVAQRERLNREVEIAQEVQERLFPQNLPEIPGLDYFGYCRPARGVGGDSYDFLPLESGLFGFAIGDVSGKGIPAALLMASLQSALRGQAMTSPEDLGQLMGNMNRLIYDSSPSNRYATLFYGQFNPADRMLTYCNGGHNPPMILRGNEILRLDAGGPVVGLFRPGRYTQGSIRIEPCDVLVGFTDGISEAMNAADEEWGEDAMAAFLWSVRDLSARQMIPKILEAADAFAAGHPQHDDMTVIVIRFALDKSLK
jgi:sigma-B regulation protein RsbU (phosphoserine phosphatase)